MIAPRFVAALVLSGLAMPVSAHHCWMPTTSEAVSFRAPADPTESGVPAEEDGWWTFYLATDACSQLVAGTACLPGVVGIYVESNGIGGLQRRDVAADDTCHGLIPADQLTQ